MTVLTNPRALNTTGYDLGDIEETAEVAVDGDAIFDVSEWLEPDGWDLDEERVDS